MSSPAETLNELFKQCPQEILLLLSHGIVTPGPLNDRLFKRKYEHLEDDFLFTNTLDLINTVLMNAGMHVVKTKLKTLDDGREVIDGFEIDTSITPGKRHGPN